MEPIWYRRLHWQIIPSLVLGILYGVLAAAQGWTGFTRDWIAPFATIFIDGLKLIAVPLILASLVTGVASLSDLRKLSRIGGTAMGIYIATTAIAVTLGLLIVNVLRPGHQVPETMHVELQETYAPDAIAQEAMAADARGRGPLQLFVDLVPDNFFRRRVEQREDAAGGPRRRPDRRGVGSAPGDGGEALVEFFDSASALTIRLVDIIMCIAPPGDGRRP